MKYKLINNQTKEEHLCDKVTLDGFDYYVSDKESESNDWCYYSKDIKSPIKYQRGEYLTNGIKSPKVIATNNSNIDIPKVVDEIEILAWDIINNNSSIIEDNEQVIGFTAFMEGYNKSQETNPFSEDDMIDFYEWCDTSDEAARFWSNNKINPDMNGSHYQKIKNKRKELLQIWKEQQPKTLYYA